MKFIRFLKWASLTAMVITGLTAHAEDIDIYQGGQTGTKPNLLFILDNAAAASASSSFTCSNLAVNDPGKNLGFEQCGLYGAVASIASKPTLLNHINLGLMYFPTGSEDGGQFVLPSASPAPNSLLLMDGTTTNGLGVNKMLTIISQLSLNKDKSNNNQISQAMQEAWAFYQGKKGLSNIQYPGLSTVSCSKNFVVYLTLATNNQKPQDTGNVGLGALQTAQALSFSPPQVTLPKWKSPISPFKVASGKYQADASDEWAKFMYPDITTYTIVLSDGSNPDYEQLMVSMANQGGGKAFIVQLGDLSALANAIDQIFNEVQATNSVFAAPVLPVSANAQGTYLNQLFIGMFRPDANDNPRWVGNLKQYQIGVNTSDPTTPQLFLADASWNPYQGNTSGNAALSAAGTGFISPNAVSFWTSKNTATLPDSKLGFWLNSIKQQGGLDGFDSVDGQVVEKGGSAQQTRLKHLTETYPHTTGASSTTSRNLFTCIGCSAGAALNSAAARFNAANAALTASALGITASTPAVTATNLINWVRGEDTFAQITDAAAGQEANTPPDSVITVRGSMHGDVLHSRPVVINYGGTTGVVAFYGANDGVFRAVNGNQPNNSTDKTKPLGYCTSSATCAINVTDAQGNVASVPPGGELWGFVAQEFYGKLQRLYQNSPALKIGTMTVGTPKNYFFDGPTSVYHNPGTGKAYIFLSARRGGRLLYALDVSDPAAPRFMWKHTNADSGFAEMGQTWLQPKAALIKGYADAAGNPKPVLIFGAGYDTSEDSEPPTANAMGRGIFILDATTGDMLWQAIAPSATCAGGGVVCMQVAGMTSSIAADITLVDRNFDGFIDRLYAADLGGNIWRVDLEPEGVYFPAQLKVSQLAALGGAGITKRKLLFPPDVVMTKTYDAVVVASGDREHPMLAQQASSIANRFYMIKDISIGLKAAAGTVVRDDSSSSAFAAAPALFDATTALYDKSLSGFYVNLLGAGEKGVNASTTVGGTVYFGTNQPLATSVNSCQANLGKAKGYAVSFISGVSKSTVFDGGGLMPSPVFGVVNVLVNGKAQKLPFLIGAGGVSGADARSGIGVTSPVIPVSMKKKRTYWFRNIDR